MRKFTFDTRVRNILIALGVLWLLTALPFSLFDIVIVRLLGFTLTLGRLFVGALVVWLALQLPSPFREIATLLMALWFIYAFALFGGFTWIVTLVLVLFLFFYIIGLLGG